MDSFYLIFPLVAAFLYAIAAFWLKGAQRRGVSSIQAALYANGLTAVAFMALFFPWADGAAGAAQIEWGRAFLVGLAFALGQVTTVLAFEKGAVSVATPMLGSKVILVALVAAFLFGDELAWSTWLAAGLTTLGVVLLARSKSTRDAGDPVLGLVLAFVAALSFAVFDVMVAEWSPRQGFGRLVPVGMVIAVALSLPMGWLQPGRALFTVPRVAMRPLALGVVLLTAQALVLIWSIGEFQDAAGANVVYGSRGIWSVLVVVVLSRFYKDIEAIPNRAALVNRLIGSVLILAAIAALIVFR